MKNLSTKKIDEIGLALLEYNNQISLLEYRETKEKIDLSKEIQQVCLRFV